MDNQTTRSGMVLRRTPRRANGSSSSPAHALSQKLATSSASITPSKPRARKRVRFSDPGPELSQPEPASTGLTPMVQRSSLAGPSPKRRRHSTPFRSRASEEVNELAEDESTISIRIFPLRQVLDDRLKRRIKRNGLSEEMNSIHEEKKQRVHKYEEELQKLREQLAAKDEEIESLRDMTVVQDTDRIMELEHQMEELKNELSDRSEDMERTQRFDWTLAARDPFSDNTYGEDDGFGESTMADIVCSTPSRNRGASFPTPPCTSPAMPATPCSMRRTLVVTPRSHAGVQADFPDLEKQALETELASLRLELAKLTEALDAHDALKARIEGKLPKSSADAQESSDLEANLDKVLQTLSDRTTALLELNSSLSCLGFPGKDAGEIIASLAASFRSARLELEYLSPGEIAIPLSSHGAEVLDLVLSRLRELAKKVREDEGTIDEYHELELSLRQQLGARVDAMDGMSLELKASAADVAEKAERISELEVGIDRLKGAVEGYRRDVVELENLVQRMESEGSDAAARLTAEVDDGKQEIASKDASIAALEEKLSSVLQQTADLRTQLADIQARKMAEVASLNKAHGGALALRDARVAELRLEIDSINRELREAHETVQQLRVANASLAGGVEAERTRAKAAVDAMKAELERVLLMSEGILVAATPRKGAQGRRSSSSSSSAVAQRDDVLAGGVPGSNRGKKRRRYDSGLGFLDEEELDH